MKWRTTTGNLTVPIDFSWTVPLDVSAVVLLVALVDALSVGGSNATAPLRALVGLPALLFVPGYLLLAVLFPRGGVARDESDARRGASDGILATASAAAANTIGWKERIALAFGTSVALIPLLGFLVAPVTGSLSSASVLLGLNTFVLVGAAGAVARRNRLPEGERLRVPHRRWRGALLGSFGRWRSSADAVLTGLLVVIVLAAVVVMGTVLVSPGDGEAYTSTTLLTEDGGGSLVAAGYPAEIAFGGGADLVLSVENHEGVETTYTVVAELQRVDTSGDSVTVVERDRLLEERNSVEAGDTWLLRHTVVPAMAGSDLRLTYYVYRGDPPSDPDVDSAYRSAYIWVDVVRPGDSG